MLFKKVSALVILSGVFLGCSTPEITNTPTTGPSPRSITAFGFTSPLVAGTITEASGYIHITVPSGTVITSLTPNITHTGTSISPASGVAQNFTSDVLYTVTGADTTTAIYTVKVTVAAPITGTYIADHKIAKESVLRGIPDSYINLARNLRVSYNHTSHGTHVTYGAFGLPGYKAGDATKFAVTTTNPQSTTALYINDQGGDLSVQGDGDWSAWRNMVRAYLDTPGNSPINVVMWSWCNIAGHDVPNYLSSMETLIGEYGAGGSKVGTSTGQRSEAVTFIFMTGHANGGTGNLGAGNPKDQAKLIVDYCKTKGYFCIDYYAIDTHAMDDTYYEDADDDATSATYGGNFNLDWQNAHTKGTDWYDNRNSPGGTVAVGAHNTQHITANRKAYAFWWVLSRIVGYP